MSRVNLLLLQLLVAIAAVLLIGFCAASFTEMRRGRVPLGVLALALCLGLVLVQRVAPFERRCTP